MLSLDVIALAKSKNWQIISEQHNIGMVSFLKDSIRINVYYTKMTVATCLNHPKKGKTQLFRKNVTIEELKLIFENPRIHTKKGYYTKNS